MESNIEKRYDELLHRFYVKDIAETIFGNVVDNAYVQLDSTMTPDLVEWKYLEEYVTTPNLFAPIYDYPIVVILKNGKKFEIFHNPNEEMEMGIRSKQVERGGQR